MARVRVRQHVNPLAHKYQTPITPPDWERVYANPAQPLHLDIGCARGKFLLQMAPLYPQMNFLGIEIREPLVDEANSYRDRLELSNLYFLYCNIANSLAPLLKSLPTGVLQQATIQFPDPWFKQRHLKRRMVQPELVDLLATYMVEGGRLFLQSDVESVAIEMRSRIQAHPNFQQHSHTWLETNPFPIPTEREIATLAHNKPVYRALFQKKSDRTTRSPISFIE
ncbi:MAG: tRNA (guanosine(46)-N7)-methyltransferase TrmB [Hydrococcus sp. Prado102]|nr:tRNA (guanosine(46)-N7)-methyltransferase TrmB [Hydrococcus sp. Prado102]